MRKIGHWTPRYVVNRVAWFVYERRNMDKPWLTPRAVELLSELILPTDTGIEWGSGRSTAWFAKRLKQFVKRSGQINRGFCIPCVLNEAKQSKKVRQFQQSERRGDFDILASLPTQEFHIPAHRTDPFRGE